MMRYFGSHKFVAVFALLVPLFGCDKCSSSKKEIASNVPATEREDVKASAVAKEFKMIDVVEGAGDPIAAGKTAVVNYTGWLSNGTKFDSSFDRNQPFPFPLGGGRVIAGWDEGVVGMKVGGKRILVIPPEKGYGAAGAGGVIPPDSVLIFEVDLVEIQ